MSIACQSDQGVATITFDRAAKKNAITADMYEQFVAHLKQAEADAAVRAVVITGAGGTFTAGNDLKDFANPKRPVEGFMGANPTLSIKQIGVLHRVAFNAFNNAVGENCSE